MKKIIAKDNGKGIDMTLTLVIALLVIVQDSKAHYGGNSLLQVNIVKAKISISSWFGKGT